MEVYLNSIEMGRGIFGVEAAANAYFSKSAASLTRPEAALIAVSLPNPRKRNPAAPTAYMRRRQGTILSLMRKVGAVPIGVGGGASSADGATPEKGKSQPQPQPKSKPEAPAEVLTPEPLPEEIVTEDEADDLDETE